MTSALHSDKSNTLIFLSEASNLAAKLPLSPFLHNTEIKSIKPPFSAHIGNNQIGVTTVYPQFVVIFHQQGIGPDGTLLVVPGIVMSNIQTAVLPCLCIGGDIKSLADVFSIEITSHSKLQFCHFCASEGILRALRTSSLLK
eukprot:CAMPEP_0114979254 /NCGR_PEP_ID=MMETSP0216-20121206/4264_1 /TAXON_ID=223996 /ORGANISM="Protocruzia adherens, Strain Boccale" /LENGTH=141 /DNA_ID=CAMNT_0002340549 /DNA_START=239 /DNA_END=664 /DNA_ORIENTATION=-